MKIQGASLEIFMIIVYSSAASRIQKGAYAFGRHMREIRSCFSGTDRKNAPLAVYLKTTRQQVRRMIQCGELRAVKVGREYRITLAALAEFLEE